MVKLFVAVALLTVSYACKDADYSNPMDEDFYQGLRFEYNEESNLTTVGAIFRLGTKDGEKVRLSPPAFLLINGDICSDYDETKEYPYSVIFESRLPEAVINFTDFKERIFANNVKLDSLENVGELVVNTDRKDKTVTVSFTGEKQSNSETITLVIIYEDSEYKYDVQPEGNNSITLDSDIASLYSGKEIGIKIVRVKSVKLNNVSSAGGDLQLVYTSRERRVQL